MPSAGAQRAGTQSYRPKVITLARQPGSPTQGAKTVSIMIPVPDPRLRIKIDLLWVPLAGYVDDGTIVPPTANLWLYETEEDDSGTSGTTIPCTDLLGTRTVPNAIMTGDKLGFSKEFVTAADYIEGILSLEATINTPPGNVVLQTRASPQSVRFTDEEWDDITRNFTPTASHIVNLSA